jgi:hypothetical protein
MTQSRMNPYRVAAFLILDRLKWDLKRQSWTSRAALKQLKNKHRGEKAVIVCNGPSLMKTDLSLLDDVYTFGLNKINLMFDQASFRPSCVVAVNPFVIEQNKEFYRDTSIATFLESRAGIESGLLNSSAATFLHSIDLYSFAKDCSFSIFQGYTVTYVAMQLAYHMGFSKVALIGCDHNFHVNGRANEIQTAEGDDASHFHKDYFADGQQWQLPDLRQSESCYELAKNNFEANGRELLNATVGGQLELLPRTDLSDFLNS